MALDCLITSLIAMRTEKLNKIQCLNWLDSMNTGKQEIEGKHKSNKIHEGMNVPELS